MASTRNTTNKDVEDRRWGLPLVCCALWMLSLASAIGVIYSTYETRQATQQLEELRREAGDMQVNAGKYLLEKSTLAAYTRVEREAHTKLNMVVPPVETLELVRQ